MSADVSTGMVGDVVEVVDLTTSAMVRAAVCLIVHLGESMWCITSELISLVYSKTALLPPTFSSHVFSNCFLVASSKSCLAKKTKGTVTTRSVIAHQQADI